jgi:hypothetical protein
MLLPAGPAPFLFFIYITIKTMAKFRNEQMA